jgi:predicted metal-dependent hydrolase
MCGEPVVILSRKGTAKRLTLRFHPLKRHFILSAPKRASHKVITAFIARHTLQMQHYLAALPPPIKLRHGEIIPIFGEEYCIAATPLAECSPPRFLVLATASHCGMATKTMLQRILKEYIEQRITKIIALPMFSGIPLPEVTLRETVSRWGSCSSAGKLMFSWRLVFAPRHVVDYIIAHECAHLLHHNHSQAFWKLNSMLHPEITLAKGWLKRYHHYLFRYIT